MQLITRLRDAVRKANEKANYLVGNSSPSFPFDIEGKRTLLEALQNPINPTVEEILYEVGINISSIAFCRKEGIPLKIRADGSIDIASTFSRHYKSILPYVGYLPKEILSPINKGDEYWFLGNEFYSQLIRENPELEQRDINLPRLD